MTKTVRALNDCGCCEGTVVETPVEIFNRPGLSAIAYRSGTHARFKRSMLARLSGVDLPTLTALTAREDDDFSIALLDAWATVADVLTFYQERFANESYLRTATERLSLLQLARLIGYELRPGVAASGYLAFTLDDAPGSPGRATIDVGVKISSVPAQDQKPQTFETIEKIAARAEWNALKPRLTQRHPLTSQTRVLYFEGISTGLRPGDGLLIAPDDKSAQVFCQVRDVTSEPVQQRTKVTLQFSSTPDGSPASIMLPRFIGESIQLTDSNVAFLRGSDALGSAFKTVLATQPPTPRVLVFRTKAAIFGHNAPLFGSLPISLRVGELDPHKKPGDANSVVDGIFKDRKDSWAETALDKYHGRSGNVVDLDASYPSIAPTSDKPSENKYVVLKTNAGSKDITHIYKIIGTTELSKSDFALTAKITRLFLDSKDGFEKFPIRTTTVFAQSEELPLARLPIETPVPRGKEIELEGLVDLSPGGQRLVVCGELARSDKRGNFSCEDVVTADITPADDIFTVVKLAQGLKNDYVRDTVTIYGNVALATHGESVQEALGSGDSSQASQRFILRQPPLTHISSSAPSGADSTLRVRVNDVLWHEVPTLFGHGPRDRIYVTRIEDDGTTSVQFGDGQTGARLPSGQENVGAAYRKGIGLDGLLEASQLTTLITRPPGVRSVTNPLKTSGAQDRESVADARRNAPLTVLTLDRIVSLQDYEDFTRAFAGIAKALATWTWSGQVRGVFLTVAAEKGEQLQENRTHQLLSAIRDAGDPHVSVRVASYRQAFFDIAGTIIVHPDFDSSKVLAAVRDSLRVSFSFDARAFGQPVSLSEVMALIQSTPGVIAVDIDAMLRMDGIGGDGINNPLPAATPQVGAEGNVLAAELLMLPTNSLGELGVAR